MKIRVLTGAILLAAAVPALAQVTVNPKALEPLGGAARHANAPERHHRHQPRHRHGAKHHHVTTHEHRGEKKTEQPRAQRPAARREEVHRKPSPPAKPPRSLVKQPPVVPLAPPPVPVLTPLVPPPPKHPAPPPQPIPVVAGAMGEATTLGDGVRLTFAGGSADLNPATDAALQKLAHETAAKPDAIVTVKGYASGSADDPSAARRLSLTRALVARAVLLAQGISSTRIYVRALGSHGSGGPPDRVDVTVSGAIARGKS